MDSTSFHYDGKANADEGEPKALHITKGYSRDHRPDLNQGVLNLICENQSGIPVYMQAANGNTNDMEGFKKIVKAHIGSLKAAQQCRYLVANAALYVKDTIVDLTAQSLMVYASLEHRIRKELKAQDDYFAAIDLLTINQQQTLLLNIKDRQTVIIKNFRSDISEDLFLKMLRNLGSKQ